MKRLRDRVDGFEDNGLCEKSNVSFRESQAMPYLRAVMNEALRMHSATVLSLWRVGSEGSIELCGYIFPENTVVGINTWCAHFNGDIFLKDAAILRPKRRIETEKEGGDKLEWKEMNYMSVSVWFLQFSVSVLLLATPNVANSRWQLILMCFGKI